jgi:hypothetical protein
MCRPNLTVVPAGAEVENMPNRTRNRILDWRRHEDCRPLRP